MTDPFAAPESTRSGDDFDEASSDLLNVRDDLPGRLVLIYAKSVDMNVPSTAPNAKEDATYNRVIGDLVVLDGQPNGKIPTVPCLFSDIYISGGSFIPSITRPVGGGNLAPKERPQLGRVGLRKNKFGNMSATLDKPTEADKTIARKWIAEHAEPAF